MAVPSTISIKINGAPVDDQLLLTLQSLEVELGVREQGIFRWKTIMGQDPAGDWASFAEQRFSPGSIISIDVGLEANQRSLIRGYLTEFKMNFNADPCSSSLEIVGMDALEKMKRSERRRNLAGLTLNAAVSLLFNDSQILPPSSGVPNTGAASPNGQPPAQAQNDLEFIRRLADENNCEVYVEPINGTDQGFFQPLNLAGSPEIPSPIMIQQGPINHVRNASFYYDLTGPTAVTANFVDANGRALGDPVRVDLRDNLSSFDKTLLGPPGFAKVERLQRSGSETREHLQARCAALLERNSWVVVGKGELDTQSYGDLLFPRHRVRVQGAAGSFSGDYLVWKVKHTLTREQHCQTFELRRKLGVN